MAKKKGRPRKRSARTPGAPPWHKRSHHNTHARRQRQTGSYLRPLYRAAAALRKVNGGEHVPVYVGKSHRRDAE